MDSESNKTTKKTTRSTSSVGRSTKSSTTKSTETTKRSTTSKSSTRTTGTSKTAPASAKEKLEKSLKGLSFVGSGAGSSKIDAGANLNLSTDDKSRKKVGGVVLDMETIQDANKQKLSGKGNRRNVAIIIVLSVLLALSLVYLAIAVSAYFKSRKEPNCIYSIISEVDASWIIDGQKKNEFILRDGIKSGTICEIDSKLQINSIERLKIEIILSVTLNGEPIRAGLMGLNDNFVNKYDTTVYEYNGVFEGGGTIDLFTGIDFNGTPDNVTSENIKIDIVANITLA